MAERTVSVRLEADVSRFTTSMSRAAASTKALGDTVNLTLRRDVEPAMASGGERAGGKLAQGINAGLIRNSPLIAAGVAGALVAGAPAALAGAGLLFGGIAAVAGSKSVEVRRAWTSLGDEIAAGTVADAAVVFPALAGMADDLGDSFQRLRPQLRDAFEATAPLVETFTEAVTGAAENAMPGLVRAVQSADPVMAGFRSLAESTGTGVSEMFGGLATHAPAAGQAFDALGDVVGELLPLVGEFLGQGAELAAVVLPPVAQALGQVTDIVQALGPLLPAVVAGFTGLKVAGAVSTGLASMSGGLSKVAQDAAFATYQLDGFAGGAAGRASEAAGRTSRAFHSISEGVGKASAALPALGIVLGGVAANLSSATTEEEKWAQAILAGGKASTDAYAQYQTGTHWGQAIDEATGLASSWDDAKAQADEMRAAMSPLELAQLGVTAAQDRLREAVDKYGPSSSQAQAASVAYRDAQAEVERQEGRTQLAIAGVTQAMLDQYNQALAATDSAFGYRDSQNAVEDAQAKLAEVQAHLNDVNADTRTSTEDMSRAGLALEEALYRQATAAGQLASDALPATADELDRNKASAQGTLAELYRMRDEMGGAFPASLQQSIRNLEATGVTVDRTTGQFRYLGDQVNAVPGAKTISVTADTRNAVDGINGVQKTIDSLSGRTVTVSYTSEGSQAGSGLLRVQARALGGPIAGPGTGTSDSIPALLSDGEHVWTAREVAAAGGHRAVEEMRSAVLGRQRFAAGGPVSVVVKETGLSGAVAQAMAVHPGATTSPVGPAGSAMGMAGNWQSIASIVQAAIPQARINSTFRPGDPGYHGRGKAVDFGFGSGPGGAGSAGLASINRFLHDNYGGRLAELIYDGIGDDRPDLKNGRPLTYSAATRAQHANHVHAAVYHDGTDFVPQTGWAYLERGEAVIPAESNAQRGREFSGAAVNVAAPNVSVAAPNVTVLLDGQEIRATARVEAQGVVVEAVTGVNRLLVAQGVR